LRHTFVCICITSFLKILYVPIYLLFFHFSIDFLKASLIFYKSVVLILSNISLLINIYVGSILIRLLIHSSKGTYWTISMKWCSNRSIRYIWRP
jgi:hypothetical protein